MLWHCPVPERWGAFAGGFEEVDENVEYEEREDEFDIVSPRSRRWRGAFLMRCMVQEDEEEILRRKTKAEDEDVDVDAIEDGAVVVDHAPLMGEDDDDAVWADGDPDEDVKGWKMKIVMEDDADM